MQKLSRSQGRRGVHGRSFQRESASFVSAMPCTSTRSLTLIPPTIGTEPRFL